MRSLIKRYPIVSYIIVACVYAWAFWIPLLLIRGTDAPMGIIALGAYGPTVAAIALTAIAEGKTGLKNLLSKYLVWRVGILWVLAVLALPPVALLVAMGIYGLANPGTIGAFAPAKLYMVLLMPLMTLLFGPLGEELGWRGYMLPRLQERYNALQSSLILGVVWTFWHTPLFWATFGTTISGSPVTIRAVGSYLLYVTALAILFTWVYNNTKGSVLLAIVLHAIVNASIPVALFPDISTQAISGLFRGLYPIVMGLFAVVIVLIFGAARLSLRPESEWAEE